MGWGRSHLRDRYALISKELLLITYTPAEIGYCHGRLNIYSCPKALIKHLEAGLERELNESINFNWQSQVLKPGAYRYKPGLHRGYEAFRQAGPVNIWRDGTNGQYDDVLQSSINIHRGGINTTSSLGCQTVPVDQWDDFKKTGYKLLKDAGQKTFCYILVEKQG